MAASLFQRITVAIDGSPNSQEALDAAIDLARHYGGSLVILAIAPLPPVYVSTTEPFVPAAVSQSQLGRYREIVEAAVQRAEATGLTSVTGLCDEGVVVDEILGHLGRHPSDLLVVGSRGLSTARRLLLGSVSTALVNHAPCAVLVVRSPTASTPPAAPR
jgi:nucleotide-binding universal stress UspA family protein